MNGFYIIWRLVWVFVWALRLLAAALIGLAAWLIIIIIRRLIKWLRESS